VAVATKYMTLNFYDRVYKLVAQIPKGKVATYGQIAALISSPRAARQVGFAMRSTPPNLKIPWQRVINSEGRISIINPHVTAHEQARLLRQDGVTVTERDQAYWVDLKKYLHRF